VPLPLRFSWRCTEAIQARSTLATLNVRPARAVATRWSERTKTVCLAFHHAQKRRAHHAKADQHEGQAEERKHDGHDLYRAIGPWSIAEKKVGSAMYSQRSAKAVQGTTKIQIGRADQNAFQRSGQPAHWIVSPSNSVRIFLRKPGGSSSSIVR
jgi:hypothetical protein